MDTRDTVMVGGGPIGCLLAMVLARRGHDVAIFERRADMRASTEAGDRSINLVLTERGLSALDVLGLRDSVLALAVPVHGRTMHSITGALAHQPYGKSAKYVNYSIRRGPLNRLLITRAERAGVEFVFGHRFVGGIGEESLQFAVDGARVAVKARRVFGTDGARSRVRVDILTLVGGRESLEPLGYGYKELTVPAGTDGGYRVAANALHIWPRGRIMLMALPNLDGSFTATIYLPERGPDSFAQLDTPVRVRNLFQEQRLARELPGQYRSRYSMVVYSQIPYRLCQRAGAIQADILDELCRSIDDPQQVDMTSARDRLLYQHDTAATARGIVECWA